MSGRRKVASPPATPRRLADCGPGDIVQTRAGWLKVGDQVKGGTLVELWHPDEQRRLSATFGCQDVEVISVIKRQPRPPVAGGDYDPVRG